LLTRLWSPSYFAASCGGAPLGIIKQYVEQQKTPLERALYPPAGRGFTALLVKIRFYLKFAANFPQPSVRNCSSTPGTPPVCTRFLFTMASDEQLLFFGARDALLETRAKADLSALENSTLHVLPAKP